MTKVLSMRESRKALIELDKRQSGVEPSGQPPHAIDAAPLRAHYPLESAAANNLPHAGHDWGSQPSSSQPQSASAHQKQGDTRWFRHQLEGTEVIQVIRLRRREWLRDGVEKGKGLADHAASRDCLLKGRVKRYVPNSHLECCGGPGGESKERSGTTAQPPAWEGGGAVVKSSRHGCNRLQT